MKKNNEKKTNEGKSKKNEKMVFFSLFLAVEECSDTRDFCIVS